MLPVLLGSVGLAVEGGFALAQRQRMQAAADLAALNAAYCQLNPSKTLCANASSFPGSGGNAMQGMALSVAKANGYTGSSVTVVTPYQGNSNRIAVTVAQPVSTTLLNLIGWSSFNVSGRAVGGVQYVPVNFSLLALNPTKCGAISLSGNGTIDTSAAPLQVDSNCSTALTASGNTSVTVTSANIYTVGGYSLSGNATFSPTPITGSQAVADPMASLNPPDGSGLTNKGAFSCGGNSTVTIYPGIYTSFNASSNCVVTMQPGTYVLQGGGMSVSGNAGLMGSGVFIYNAGSSFPSAGGSFGAINLSGNGTFNLTPPSSGPYTGLMIFQSRDNPSTLSISGNGLSGVQGTIYGPSTPISITGNGTIPAQFIVDSVNISGNGSLTVQYNASQLYSASNISLLE
jgi:hypothetical protein